MCTIGRMEGVVVMATRPRNMDRAPVGAIFSHVERGLTSEEILQAVTILVTREAPSSFAVTSGEDGRYDLRLSRNSYRYLSEKLAKVGR